MKHFVFDFDGTLADTMPAVIDLFNTLAPRYKCNPIDPNDIDRLRKKGIREILKEQKISFFRLPGLLLEAKGAMKKIIPGLVMDSRLKEVLFTLREQGIRLSILSSNTRENIQLFLEHNQIKIFDSIIPESSLDGKKRLLNRFARKNRIPKENIYYIGDEIRDVEASKKARVKACAVTWGYNDKEALLAKEPDFLIERPEDLIALITPIRSDDPCGV